MKFISRIKRMWQVYKREKELEEKFSKGLLMRWTTPQCRCYVSKFDNIPSFHYEDKISKIAK